MPYMLFLVSITFVAIEQKPLQAHNSSNKKIQEWERKHGQRASGRCGISRVELHCFSIRNLRGVRLPMREWGSARTMQ
jgi:hypothetical protein